jgi:hypothetical protein
MQAIQAIKNALRQSKQRIPLPEATNARLFLHDSPRLTCFALQESSIPTLPPAHHRSCSAHVPPISIPSRCRCALR